MFEKFNKDGLLLHKIGLLVGAIIGFLFGLFVSDKADSYEIEAEEVSDETSPSV